MEVTTKTQQLINEHSRPVQKIFDTFINENKSSKWLLEELEAVSLVFDGRRNGADIWFRFFKNDTGATTIWDIERTLVERNETQRNIEYMMECIAIGVAEKSIQLNFS